MNVTKKIIFGKVIDHLGQPVKNEKVFIDILYQRGCDLYYLQTDEDGLFLGEIPIREIPYELTLRFFKNKEELLKLPIPENPLTKELELTITLLAEKEEEKWFVLDGIEGVKRKRLK